MDNLIGIIPVQYLPYVTMAVTIAAALAAALPPVTPTSNKAYTAFRKVLDLVAFNFGNAANQKKAS